jgi:glycosyltransferase involved in cell wall biosynthesis
MKRKFMRITFLTPGYIWGPSGGIRVVYEYANRLVARGHEVAVVHPRKLKYPPPAADSSANVWLREKVRNFRTLLRPIPIINWQPIDNRVDMQFVPSSGSRHLPDSDVIFATGWTTVQSVLELPPSKGEKCYMIQGYESYHAPKELVDATWRAPLHKMVIAKWLVNLGKELGGSDVSYIPNAIDHTRYRLTQPIEGRARRICMLFSTTQIKGSADGLEALRIVREKYPDLKVTLFGVSRPQDSIPRWAEYHRDPAQEFLINEIYNKSSIYVAPSWTEGSPLPPVEAACCGCAVVATNIGGYTEHIENGVTGLLSPVKDPVALAENICLLLGNEEMRVRLAKTCKQVVSQLNWERSVDLLENFLSEVTRRKKTAWEPIAS